MAGNPYQTPVSDLEAKNTNKRSIFWKIYFFFMCLLMILGVFGLIAAPGAGWPEMISCILIAPSMMAFFGYVFGKKIFNRQVWVVNIYAQILWAVLYYFVTNADLRAGMDDTTFIVSQTIMWFLSIPFYIAMFLYSRKKYYLWQVSV